MYTVIRVSYLEIGVIFIREFRIPMTTFKDTYTRGENFSSAMEG